jgi:hypothetical protein
MPDVRKMVGKESMNSRTILRMALDANTALLEVIGNTTQSDFASALAKATDANKALRAALAQPKTTAKSITDELMDCVDRLGSEADTVDPRVWNHLLVYAPKQHKALAQHNHVNDPVEMVVQPEPEPVATVHDAYDTAGIDWHCKDAPVSGTKLYIAPPQRKPLSDDQIGRDFYGCTTFVRKVEAAHNIGKQ